jgi:phytoene desaturase
MTRKKAIIIGSGIGGLALGIRLQSLGFDTTIFEKLDAPGGRAHSVTLDNIQVFIFANHT